MIEDGVKTKNVGLDKIDKKKYFDCMDKIVDFKESENMAKMKWYSVGISLKKVIARQKAIAIERTNTGSKSSMDGKQFNAANQGQLRSGAVANKDVEKLMKERDRDRESKRDRVLG